jgi:hypothetical protein
MMGLIIQYILALQYGGQIHPWNSSIVIGLLVGFVATLAAFIAWEIYQKERAMLVKRLVGSFFPRFREQMSKNANDKIMTDDSTTNRCRRKLHVLLRRCLLLYPILLTNLLPKCARYKCSHVGRQNASFHHTLNALDHGSGNDAGKGWCPASILDLRCHTGHYWMWAILHNGHGDIHGKVDWISNYRWFWYWMGFPSGSFQRADSRCTRRYLAGLGDSTM